MQIFENLNKFFVFDKKTNKLHSDFIDPVVAYVFYENASKGAECIIINGNGLDVTEYCHEVVKAFDRTFK